jgi:hypothetical protein
MMLHEPHFHRVASVKVYFRQGVRLVVHRCACGARKIDTSSRMGRDETSGWRAKNVDQSQKPSSPDWMQP